MSSVMDTTHSVEKRKKSGQKLKKKFAGGGFQTHNFTFWLTGVNRLVHNYEKIGIFEQNDGLFLF